MILSFSSKDNLCITECPYGTCSLVTDGILSIGSFGCECCEHFDKQITYDPQSRIGTINCNYQINQMIKDETL